MLTSFPFLVISMQHFSECMLGLLPGRETAVNYI